MTYAQLRLLGSVQKHLGGGLGNWTFSVSNFFDPLLKSQNLLNPLNKSKKKKKKPFENPKIVLFVAF